MVRWAVSVDHFGGIFSAHRKSASAAPFHSLLYVLQSILLAMNANLRVELSFVTGGFFLVIGVRPVSFGSCLTFWNYPTFPLWSIHLTPQGVIPVCLGAVSADFTTWSPGSLHLLRPFTMNLDSICCPRSWSVVPVWFTLCEAFACYFDFHWSSFQWKDSFPSLHAYH